MVGHEEFDGDVESGEGMDHGIDEREAGVLDRDGEGAAWWGE